MKLIHKVHDETHEILCNARAALKAGEITQEDYNEIVRSCFAAEVERRVLGEAAAALDTQNQRV